MRVANIYSSRGMKSSLRSSSKLMTIAAIAILLFILFSPITSIIAQTPSDFVTGDVVVPQDIPADLPIEPDRLDAPPEEPISSPEVTEENTLPPEPPTSEQPEEIIEPIIEEPATPPQENITEPIPEEPANITELPPEIPENTTLPEDNGTEPENATIPEVNITEPAPDVNMTVPENTTLPEVNITEPDNTTDNITLPEENVTLPEVNVTLPENTTNGTDDTIPEFIALDVGIDVPSKITRGETLKAIARVSNRGLAPADKVLVMWTLPEGFEIVSGSAFQECGTINPNSFCEVSIEVFVSLDADLGTSNIGVRVSYE